ncbi:ATP-binding protein [Comamonas aquatica]|uniref:ATP-binding protein n=1 Tax=Comamonas aquatica TaxID=225991 RepID=A0AA42HVH3_9BURK|nr:ATP-binding protein [Comamonas aquatica]MDH0365113.1 ATP-binding protein [Comamonas aquatica]
MSESVKFSGVAEIGNEGIKKHFQNIELWDPLFELVWNGFDAKADKVAVNFSENEFESICSATVLDDGEGIDHTTLKETFGRFYDSSKKADPGQHGAHGRGRLAFHRLCRNASWYTRTRQGDAVIEIDAADIKSYTCVPLRAEEQRASVQVLSQGTLVELTNFTSNLPSVASLVEKFSTEFGWFLAVRPSKSILVNGKTVEVPANDLTQKQIVVESDSFDVQVIRWEDKPTSEKSYIYLMNGSGELVYKTLSTLNNKPNFFTSVCITSSWANQFASEESLFDPLAHTPASDVWKKLWRQLGVLTNAIYEEFLRKKADEVVQSYEDKGYFPLFQGLDDGEKAWRHAHARELVKQIYIADPQVFNNASKKQLKIIIRLLDRLAVSNENDALLEVINGALDLDDQSTKQLAEQLKRTSMENIVSTIEILQRRAVAVDKLRYVMNEHYREVLETPDLQLIIESNTWLFGPKYETLGAEEDTFTKITKKFRDEAMAQSAIDEEDVENLADLKGAQRQTDLFLARRIPTTDSLGNQIYKCLIVEIKRPAVSLNKKHLRQLEDYADIIRGIPEFDADNMYFELVLVGRKISSADKYIKRELQSHSSKGENGLVSDGDPKMKLYVLNWYTLLNSFELTNSFMLEKLRLKRTEFDGLTKQELIKDLQEEH